MSDIKSVDFLSAQVSGYAVDNDSQTIGLDLITTIQRGKITQGSVRIISKSLYGRNFEYNESLSFSIAPTESDGLKLSSLVKDQSGVITVVFKRYVPLVGTASTQVENPAEQITLSFMEQDIEAYKDIIGSNSVISYSLE